MTDTLTDSAILRQYAARTPKSADRYRRAAEVFPGGITHEARHLRPHPLFVSHASGSRKWDLDGNEYVDYFGGHGALLLGHAHPAVTEAVRSRLALGTHFGASHDLELEWAELICQMVPCAQRVRFTSSGTEATLLSLRVARAYSGKPRVVRFAGHFHGWHDHVSGGPVAAGQPSPPGILRGISAMVTVVPPNDLPALEEALNGGDDIAAVIVEPTGASFGHVPQGREYLAALRQLTSRRGIVLIFDEVITGFRCAPGGAQEYFGVTPDLTTLAKALAGGYPGGALVGSADIMAVLDSGASGGAAVPHQGTFNGTPVSASAGIATLALIRASNMIENANRQAAALRAEMNAAIQRVGAGWCVYGDFSGFHIFTNPGQEAVNPADIQAGKIAWDKLKAPLPAGLYHRLRAGFLCTGVDVCTWPGGWVSGVHDWSDVDRTASAFEKLLRMLAAEGQLE